MIKIEPARRLELHLSYTCGQKCGFCSESVRMDRWRHAPLKGEEISATLLKHRKAGFNHVTFTGGEPTAHPLLPAALSAARKLGFNTYLTTNGGLFAQEAYAREVLPLLDEVCLSVHGPDAETHDAAAATPGSFERAMKALANIEQHGDRVYLLTNTVVTRANWGRLEDTLTLLTKHPKIRHILLSSVAPEGRALKDYKALAVPLSQWRDRVPALARPFETNGVVLRMFGLPLCVLDGRPELSNDAHYSPRVTVERRGARSKPGLVAIASADASRRRSKPVVCRSCDDRGDCAGVFDRYLALHGPAELTPRRSS
ncbi:MAG: radical SAM protein [Elusimicrobia bacterium]|nr:radical SAM protein [Elusimicrobiota bacterium]